jgi:hypothetical protein
MPSFIRMKEEPQITERMMKIPQLTSGLREILSIKDKDSKFRLQVTGCR